MRKRHGKRVFAVTPAGRRELKQILELENSIFEEADRFTRSRFRHLLASPNSAIFLCRHRKSWIGYGIALHSRLRNGKSRGRIYSLGVVQEWRQRGIGKMLLKELEGWLTGAGVSFISLEARKDRPRTVKFFEKNTYRVVETLPRYYGSKDGIRMRKKIGQK